MKEMAHFIRFIPIVMNNKATVMKCDNEIEKWALVGTGSFSANEADSTAIAIDKNGISFVVYSDYNIDEKVTVMKYSSVGVCL